MKLDVVCPNTDGDRKCTQRGTPFKIDEHRVSKCKLRILTCPNYGCVRPFPCDKLLDHFRSCTKWVLGADGKTKFTLRAPATNRFPFAETLSEAIYKISCSIPIERGGSDSENEETAETRFAARRMEARRQQRRTNGSDSQTLHRSSFLPINPQGFFENPEQNSPNEDSEREDSPVPFPINLDAYRRPTRIPRSLARARTEQSRTSSSSRPEPPTVVNLRGNPGDNIRRPMSSWLTNTNLTRTSLLAGPTSHPAGNGRVMTRWTVRNIESTGFVFAKFVSCFQPSNFLTLYFFLNFFEPF
jgi:hypothetical protein